MSQTAQIARDGASALALAPAPAMPARAPLAMPVQDLHAAPKPARRGGGGPLPARLFVFGGACCSRPTARGRCTR